MFFYEEFDYIFDIVVYGDEELDSVVRKFNSRKDQSFYISYTGIAPRVLNLNPSYRVIFIKHRDKLRNTSPGLYQYLQAIVKDCGIDKRVGLLNS
jgi:hypothetical protein